MSVLVTYGSKRGGTEGIAQQIAGELREQGFTVDLKPVEQVRDVRPYEAVIVGGSLYMFRWHPRARRLVLKHQKALREKEVWLFSSGPLDQSATDHEIKPLPSVQALMNLVGANGHATFGGRLLRDAKGFPATAMAKEHSGDFRDPEQIANWSRQVGRALQAAAVRGEPRRMHEPVPLPRPWELLVELALVGGSALFGGLSMVLSPSGSLLHLPLRLLQHSPFSDFLVPGLLLALVVGLGNLWALALHWRRYDLAPMVSFFGGAVLLVYIVTEMVMLRTVHWAHVVYVVLALMIAVRSIRMQAADWKAAVPPPPRPAH